jgi:hypothetical protein
MQKLSLICVDPEPLPSFGEVMNDVKSLLRLLYEALDAGATVCRKYYDENCDGETPEAHLREMIVRQQAKRYLVKNGQPVTELRECRLRVATEPLISLLLHYKGFALRVLKAKQGIPPGCGLSKRRRQFYNQASVGYLGDDGKPAWSKTNLLVLWDFAPSFGIGRVWLACPEVAGARSQDVVLAWQELIPNPIVQGTKPQETPAEAAQLEEIADQEIEALLLGPDSPGPSSVEKPDLFSHRTQPQINTSAPVAGELEEGEDDWQSDKVGA